MNEERVNELQKFAEDFNRMIEDAHYRYEEVGLQDYVMLIIYLLYCFNFQSLKKQQIQEKPKKTEKKKKKEFVYSFNKDSKYFQRTTCLETKSRIL